MTKPSTPQNMLSKSFVEQYKNKQPDWGFNGLGYIVYKRTYSRLKPDGSNEEWFETVERCVNGAQKIGAGYTDVELERIYDYVFNLKCNFAGRMLWQLGTSTVDRFGANSLLNCLRFSTKVFTRQGWKQIGDLAGKEVEIVTKNGKWVTAPFKSYGKQKLMKTSFSDEEGYETIIYSTPEHRWFVLDRNHNSIETITSDLKNGDKVPVVLGNSNWSQVISNETTDLEEEVYCAEVPETHSFVIEGNILTGNCWATAMREPKAFLFLFENLMLGGGVGYSIRREDVHELPKIKKGVEISHLGTKDADFILPDTREGWVKLLSNLLDAFYVTGKSFTYSTILVRGYGEPINGFGGKASGPQILMDGIEKITKIFQGREGKKLRSLDVLDICNIIGSVVVAGNVRRSAEIALGDPDDILYLRAKNWGTGNVPNWRAMSNNTIYADSYSHIMDEVWQNGYEINKSTGYSNGEPYGFFNLPLSQKFGRIKDGPLASSDLYPTDADNCEMTNPCAEISLANYECCNLCELYLNNITSKEELIDCAKLLYKTQKAISALPFLHEETNKIVHKNMRLGLGVTGVCQSLDKVEWLDECYVELRKFDKEWSHLRGWPRSIKLTTVKPSGTLSLLAGSTPGVHPAFSEYYMRTVRMSSSDALVQICKDIGYKTEFLINFDGTENYETVVVYFPCQTPEGSILAKDMDVIKQLEMVKKMQTIWSDNAVSVTAYYTPEELDSVKAWLKDNYQNNIKSVSFLLFKDHGFKQAPYQEITKEEYLLAKSKVKQLTPKNINSNEILDIAECAGGVCPIR